MPRDLRIPTAGSFAASVFGGALDSFVARRHEKEQQRIRADELAQQDKLRRDQLAQQQGQFEASQAESRRQFDISHGEKIKALQDTIDALRQQAKEAKTGKTAETGYKSQGAAADAFRKAYKTADPRTVEIASQIMFLGNKTPAEALEFVQRNKGEAAKTATEFGLPVVTLNPTPSELADRRKDLEASGQLGFADTISEGDADRANQIKDNYTLRSAKGESPQEAMIGSSSEAVSANMFSDQNVRRYLPLTPSEPAVNGQRLAQLLTGEILGDNATVDEQQQFLSVIPIDPSQNYTLAEAASILLGVIEPDMTGAPDTNRAEQILEYAINPNYQPGPVQPFLDRLQVQFGAQPKTGQSQQLERELGAEIRKRMGF